jgi:flagellar protein FliS
MNYANPWQSYRQVTTNTASPGQLVVMLYDGAIKFLEHALTGFDFDDPLDFNSTINNNLIRAQNIITELNASLDMEQGGEIAVTLRDLYDYMTRRIIESNLRKTREGIEEVIRHLTVLRDAWREIAGGSPREAAFAGAGNLCACG